jgi:hypothetical protein
MPRTRACNRLLKVASLDSAISWGRSGYLPGRTSTGFSPHHGPPTNEHDPPAQERATSMQKTEHELPTLNGAQDAPKRAVEPSISQSRMVSAQAVPPQPSSARDPAHWDYQNIIRPLTIDDQSGRNGRTARTQRESRLLWKIYYAEGRTVVQPSSTLKHVLLGAARDWRDAQDGLDEIHLHYGC